MDVAAHKNTSGVAGLAQLVADVRSELERAMGEDLTARRIALNLTQVRTLRRLRQLGPTGAGALARSLYHDGGAMTRVLDQLERLGHVKRHVDPTDRRARIVALTPAGDALATRLGTAADEVLGQALAPLDDRERAQLTDCLQRVLAGMRAGRS